MTRPLTLAAAARLDPLRAAHLAANADVMRTHAAEADARRAANFCTHRQQSGECPKTCKEQQQ